LKRCVHLDPVTVELDFVIAEKYVVVGETRGFLRRLQARRLPPGLAAGSNDQFADFPGIIVGKARNIRRIQVPAAAEVTLNSGFVTQYSRLVTANSRKVTPNSRFGNGQFGKCNAEFAYDLLIAVYRRITGGR
jgi:hypothetical protein